MKHKSKIVTMTTVALCTAIISILGPLAIPLPFSPVPIALCIFAIYIAAYALGALWGTASVALYLLLGLIGVPVFAETTGTGPGAFAGATGGYLIGYLFIAFFSGLFIQKFEKKIYMHVVGILIGLTICYVLGVIWLAHVTGLSLWGALCAGFFPYLPGDAAKIILGMLVGIPLRKALKKI